MSDYNLFLEPDEDLETFRDIITDNVFINGKLLKKGEKKSFGNMCILEGVNNTNESDDLFNSNGFCSKGRTKNY